MIRRLSREQPFAVFVALVVLLEAARPSSWLAVMSPAGTRAVYR